MRAGRSRSGFATIALLVCFVALAATAATVLWYAAHMSLRCDRQAAADRAAGAAAHEIANLGDASALVNDAVAEALARAALVRSACPALEAIEAMVTAEQPIMPDVAAAVPGLFAACSSSSATAYVRWALEHLDASEGWGARLDATLAEAAGSAASRGTVRVVSSAGVARDPVARLRPRANVHLQRAYAATRVARLSSAQGSVISGVYASAATRELARLLAGGDGLSSRRVVHLESDQIRVLVWVHDARHTWGGRVFGTRTGPAGETTVAGALASLSPSSDAVGEALLVTPAWHARLGTVAAALEAVTLPSDAPPLHWKLLVH